jgi:hypothetical protein
MSRIKRHGLFTCWRADEVAECLDGVPDSIYRFLWERIVPLQEPIHTNDGEARFEEPTFDSPLSKFWNKLPEEYKRQLNRLAEQHMRK